MTNTHKRKLSVIQSHVLQLVARGQRIGHISIRTSASLCRRGLIEQVTIEDGGLHRLTAKGVEAVRFHALETVS